MWLAYCTCTYYRLCIIIPYYEDGWQKKKKKILLWPVTPRLYVGKSMSFSIPWCIFVRGSLWSVKAVFIHPILKYIHLKASPPQDTIVLLKHFQELVFSAALNNQGALAKWLKITQKLYTSLPFSCTAPQVFIVHQLQLSSCWHPNIQLYQLIRISGTCIASLFDPPLPSLSALGSH